MNRQDSDRNLLFGILALQMDFIGRDALIAAMGAWVLEKHRPIGEILVERGALDPKYRALLEPMVEAHVERHRGDPAASLAALSSVESLAADLRRSILDADVLTSLAQVTADPHATRAPDTTDFHHPVATRYRKVRDHAKGGLGIVYVALDEELRREVALKEIKPEYAHNLASQTRFLLEAEITGGLEHPGIVPVYGLGAYEDGRPFYAMRFIKGDSLKHAIATFHADPSLKTDPGARTLALQKLLRRFLDVCNAVAYAHSRGVLHRDLKPDNVMVGRYGETLVVDWGLAKSVGRSGDDDITLPEATLNPSSASGSAETLPGSVIGTPSYMSPEQAAGRLDLLGPTSDVYSLGATLYTILTGRVPVAEKDLAEVLRKVEQGEFARPREFTPWLDPALEAITLKAMALRPDDRYVSPKGLADDLERWLADEPVTAYRELWIRKTRRWVRKHRTLATSCGATALVAAILIGTYQGMVIDQRRRADASALAALEQAERLEVLARNFPNQNRWPEAVAEARRAVAHLESGGGSRSVRIRVQDKLASIQRDGDMVKRLDEARLIASASIKDDHFDVDAKHAAFRSAFQSYGIDVLELTPQVAASKIRESRISSDLIAAIDEWSSNQWVIAPTATLQSIVEVADTDPDSVAIRGAIARKDASFLLRLVNGEVARQKAGPRLRLIVKSLKNLTPTTVLPTLEAIQREQPSDLWYNIYAAQACEAFKPSRIEEAIRYYSVAVAIRPTSPTVYYLLGNALNLKGERKAAIVAYRQATRLKSDFFEAYVMLGDTSRENGENEVAIAAYRQAIRLNPNFTGLHNNLGVVLYDQKDIKGSIAACREAIRQKPDDYRAHTTLGAALASDGDLDGGIASYREAIRLYPDFPNAHLGLGVGLARKGQFDAAIEEYRITIHLKPDLAEAQNRLGNSLHAKRDFDGAIIAYREAIRLKPDYGLAQSNLISALEFKRELDSCIAAFRQSIRLLTNNFPNQDNPGTVLLFKAMIRAAVAVLTKTKSGLVGPVPVAPILVAPAAPMVPAAPMIVAPMPIVPVDETRFLAILKAGLTPRSADERLAIANYCYEKKLQAASVRYYEEAFLDRPMLAVDFLNNYRYNAACAAVLAGTGLGKDDPPPDAAAKASLRSQALVWLRADLSAWTKAIDAESMPRLKPVAPMRLDHWKLDPDLAGIRDAEHLAKLPEAEQMACRTLWADVEALRVKAGGGK